MKNYKTSIEKLVKEITGKDQSRQFLTAVKVSKSGIDRYPIRTESTNGKEAIVIVSKKPIDKLGLWTAEDKPIIFPREKKFLAREYESEGTRVPDINHVMIHDKGEKIVVKSPHDILRKIYAIPDSGANLACISHVFDIFELCDSCTLYTYENVMQLEIEDTDYRLDYVFVLIK